MREIKADAALVAACGLYCGSCRSYLKDKCPGCRENSKATWCAVRTCCNGIGIATCAECGEFADPKACGKFNNFVSRLFALIFRSDRPACIARIAEIGIESYAEEMAASKRQTIRK